jgi:aspartyl-tRNA synthetase
MKRSFYGGELRKTHAGQTVTLCGWIHSRRDHGGVLFCDLRDRSGLVQVVFRPERKTLFDLAQSLGGEFVVQVTGKVIERPEGTRNPNLSTGDIEVDAEILEILNTSKPPPFEISD